MTFCLKIRCVSNTVWLMILSSVAVVSSTATGTDLSKECTRLCNQNRPEFTNGAYVLPCSKALYPEVCESICENQLCPLNEVCVKEHDDSNNYHGYTLKCPAARPLPALTPALLFVILFGVLIALLCTYGILTLACQIYEWINWRKRLRRRQQVMENSQDTGINTDDDTDLDFKQGQQKKESEWTEMQEKTVDEPQRSCWGDTCQTNLKDTNSSLSSL